MTALTRRPDNLNLLQQVGFKFQLPRAPNFNYFIQKVQFPGVQLPNPRAANPFVSIPLPGDQMVFDNLRITFKIDENLRGYFEILDWIWHLSKPEDFDDSFEIYKRPPADVEGVYNNGTLIMLDSDMIPFLEVTFWEMLPRRLSGFTLESDVNDIQYLTAEVEFDYRVYRYKYLDGLGLPIQN